MDNNGKRRDFGDSYDTSGGAESVFAEGKNAVAEAIKSGRTVDKVFLEKGNTSLSHIAAMAKGAGAAVADVDRRKLDRMSRTGMHQGVIALINDFKYCGLQDMLSLARERGEKPLIVVCDGIEDPHNLGAVIRNAEAAGAHGVVIQKRRSPGLTESVVRSSAGAVSHMLVAKVPNIAAALRELKEAGVWVFGSDSKTGSVMYNGDLKNAAAVVIGSEGGGMSRLTAELCDFTLRIPMKGSVGSLNASGAAAVLLYEAVRQRGGDAGNP